MGFTKHQFIEKQYDLLHEFYIKILDLNFSFKQRCETDTCFEIYYKSTIDYDFNSIYSNIGFGSTFDWSVLHTFYRYKQYCIRVWGQRDRDDVNWDYIFIKVSSCLIIAANKAMITKEFIKKDYKIS